MQCYNPHNILITGNAGFIGLNLSYYFLKRYPNYRLIGLDKLTYAANHKHIPNHPHFSFIHGDIGNTQLIETTIEQYKIDTIINLAAESHVDRSIDSATEFIQTNIVGTFSLIQSAYNYWLKKFNLASNRCRFYHISTDEVYGQITNTQDAFCETTPYNPRSPYAASKASSDHILRSFFHTYGLPTLISNCSNNFGPFQHGEKLIPKIILNCLDNKPIPLYGDGSQIREWLFVEDHCRAIDLILHQGRIGESYNIGADTELANIKLTEFICDQLDTILKSTTPLKQLITFTKDRPGHDWRYSTNYAKLKTELGWSPHFKFLDAMQKTLMHYVSLRSHI